MVKVKCIVCGDTGYTASPDYLVCKCGGKFKVVPENGKREKVELDAETLRRFDGSSLIN
jgi:hypothetical protein